MYLTLSLSKTLDTKRRVTKRIGYETSGTLMDLSRYLLLQVNMFCLFVGQLSVHFVPCNSL